VWDTPYNGLYGDAHPKGVPFLAGGMGKLCEGDASFQNLVCERVLIFKNLVYERVRGLDLGQGIPIQNLLEYLPRI